MRSVLRVKRFVSLNEPRFLSQTYGLALKGKATGDSTILTQSPCSPVGRWRYVLNLQLLTAVDYRVPQMLYTLGCLKYSPRLDNHIRQLQLIKSGDTWEIELRGKFSYSLLFSSRFPLLLIYDFSCPVHFQYVAYQFWP